MCSGTGTLVLEELPQILLQEWIEGYDDDETDNDWLQEQLERLIRVRKKGKTTSTSNLQVSQNPPDVPNSFFDEDDDLIDEDPPDWDDDTEDDDWSGDGDGDGDGSGSGNGSGSGGGGGDIDDDDDYDIYDMHPRFIDLYYA